MFEQRPEHSDEFLDLEREFAELEDRLELVESRRNAQRVELEDIKARFRALERENAGLQGRYLSLQIKLAEFEKDYRAKAAELHELKDPNRHEGVHAKLLGQIGALQTQVFDLQAALRQRNVEVERWSQLTPGQADAIRNRSKQLQAIGNQVALAEGTAEGSREQIAAAANAEVDATPVADYYERLRAQLDGSDRPENQKPKTILGKLIKLLEEDGKS